MKLFCYWEGPKPWHIAACLKSVEAQCQQGLEFHLVTPDNIGDYLPAGTFEGRLTDLDSPARRADCVRAGLLAVHGGFYYDADTVGLMNPLPLASDHDLIYCVWDKPPTRVLNGYVFARPGSAIAAKWLDSINAVLCKNSKDQMPWTALGEGVLTGLVAAAPAGTVRQVPRATFLPIDIDSNVAAFFKPGDPAEVIKFYSVCFGLNHSWMMHNRRELMSQSPQSFAKSSLLFHRLITQFT